MSSETVSDVADRLFVDPEESDNIRAVVFAEYAESHQPRLDEQARSRWIRTLVPYRLTSAVLVEERDQFRHQLVPLQQRLDVMGSGDRDKA